MHAQYLETIRYAEGLQEATLADCLEVLAWLDDRLSSLTPEGVVDWVSHHVDMTHETPDTPRLELAPYQVAPIEAQVRGGVELVVIVGPEQFGKSICWKVGMLYKMVYERGPKLIVYEQAEKAAEINRRSFHPLVVGVESLRRQVEASEWAARKKSYELEGGVVVDFTGAGADITSQSYRDVVADEYDTWPLTFSKRESQMANLRKRRRRWAARREGCLVVVGSPKGDEQDSTIWRLWERETTAREWHLRCLECGELGCPSTMVDGPVDAHQGRRLGGLVWRRDDAGQVVADSVRLRCQSCGHDHEYGEHEDMNDAGEYVARTPERSGLEGYLFGGLANGAMLSWAQIARERVRAAASNDYETQRTYHNSVRGVAMPRSRALQAEARRIILSHCTATPPHEQILAVVAAADTQENPWGWYWVVRGLDASWNSYLLAAGFAATRAELEAVFGREYRGRRVRFAIVDQGGTNAEDVKGMARSRGNVWQYKGASAPQAIWKKSEQRDQHKLILGDAERLQVMLLRLIYDQMDRGNHYWALPPEPQLVTNEDPLFDYVAHVASVRDLGKGVDHELRQKWDCAAGERRDWFDCEKMLLVLLGMPLFRRQLEREMAADRGAAPAVSADAVVEPSHGAEDAARPQPRAWMGRSRRRSFANRW